VPLTSPSLWPGISPSNADPWSSYGHGINALHPSSPSLIPNPVLRTNPPMFDVVSSLFFGPLFFPADHFSCSPLPGSGAIGSNGLAHVRKSLVLFPFPGATIRDDTQFPLKVKEYSFLTCSREFSNFPSDDAVLLTNGI